MCVGSIILFLLFSLAAFADEYSYHYKPIQKDFDKIATRLNQADYNNERQDIDPHQLDQLDVPSIGACAPHR